MWGPAGDRALDLVERPEEELDVLLSNARSPGDIFGDVDTQSSPCPCEGDLVGIWIYRSYGMLGKPGHAGLEESLGRRRGLNGNSRWREGKVCYVPPPSEGRSRSEDCGYDFASQQQG
jgi:hypothetical protein